MKPGHRSQGQDNLIYLSQSGFITEQQAVAALRFKANPDRYDLPPSHFALLREALIENQMISDIEKRRSLPNRSAKALIKFLLIGLIETGPSRKASEPDLKDALEYVTGDKYDQVMAISKELGLTRREARIFLVLKHSKDMTCSKDAIFRRVYTSADELEVSEKIIDVYISKIRSKLKSSEWRIETIRGFGFALKHARPDLTAHSDVVNWIRMHFYYNAAIIDLARQCRVTPTGIQRQMRDVIDKYSDDEIHAAVEELDRVKREERRSVGGAGDLPPLQKLGFPQIKGAQNTA